MTLALTLAQLGEPLTRGEFDVPENIAFAIIAGVMLFCALKMVTTANVVHAALYLVIVLAGVAALFILLGSDFVGATQILVYIGAIIVLFLFGIMLTKARLGDDETVKSEQRTMGAAVAMLLLVVMGFALIDGFSNDEISFGEPDRIAYLPTEVDAADLATPVREALDIGESDGLVTISQADFDGLDRQVQRRIPGAEVFGNNKEIADSIFSQYIVPFEAVSVLLLAALIGAIVVARKE
ncbi:MAG: NADH-quinone oxidoreductase subunit J [Acidimicrobiales bacterium]|nr:NADH-quinone oxidoreductase subunit J [Acidimicrobiales bacterium]